MASNKVDRELSRRKMKRLLPILLLVFSVGVGKVATDLSPLFGTPC